MPSGWVLIPEDDGCSSGGRASDLCGSAVEHGSCRASPGGLGINSGFPTAVLSASLCTGHPYFPQDFVYQCERWKSIIYVHLLIVVCIHLVVWKFPREEVRQLCIPETGEQVPFQYIVILIISLRCRLDWLCCPCKQPGLSLGEMMHTLPRFVNPHKFQGIYLEGGLLPYPLHEGYTMANLDNPTRHISICLESGYHASILPGFLGFQAW